MTDEEELKAKIKALAVARYGSGDLASLEKLFRSFDNNNDGALEKSELTVLLEEAGVGNFLTRPTWAARIIERLDTNADKRVAWAEYLAVLPKPTAAPVAATTSSSTTSSSPSTSIRIPIVWRTMTDGTVQIQKNDGTFDVVRPDGAYLPRISSVLDKWTPLLMQESKRTGVPFSWLVSFVTAESNGDPRAVSPAGAVGLMQLMPMWWRGHTAEQMKDASLNARIGADLLATVRKTQKELPVVASVYNCGSSTADNKPHLRTPSSAFPWGLCDDGKHYITYVVAFSNEVVRRNVRVAKRTGFGGNLAFVALAGLAAFSMKGK